MCVLKISDVKIIYLFVCCRSGANKVKTDSAMQNLEDKLRIANKVGHGHIYDYKLM